VDAFLDKGHRLALRAWMRSPDACKVTAFVQLSREPWTKSVSASATLTPEWKEYAFEGRCLQDFQPGEAAAGLFLAHQAGTTEIAAVRLADLDAEPGDVGERPRPDRPVGLIRNGDFAQDLKGGWTVVGGQRVHASVVDAQVGNCTKAARLECDPGPGEKPWAIQIGQACTAAVARGDAVYFRAWLRSPDRCRVTFVFELAKEPHTKSISREVKLTPEWKEYRFMGRPDHSYRPQGSQAKFFLGHDKGAAEIAGVRVDNYGEAPDCAFDQTIDYWGGRAHPATWQPAARERIERVRKEELAVQVLDAAGRPVPGARVHVEQKRHHFRFGSAAPAGRLIDTDNPDNVRFQQEVERLYNTVTFENDLKWAVAGQGRVQTVEQAMQWLHSRGIALRGHCLLWGSYKYLPASARRLRGQELRQACQQHVAEYAARARGKVYVWDVVNEARTNTEVWDEIGWDAFADAFRWARAADPDALLCYNDYNIVNQASKDRLGVAERIRFLVDHRAPLDALGIQAHMSLPLTPMDQVLAVLDEWAAFGKQIEITEFDAGCPDDKVHGEYVRDFLTACFSHPQVAAFVMWGFWEGAHWRGKEGGAMFRRDWSKRPAQEAYEDLVLREWWTRWDGQTGPDGLARLRAFHGRHEVSASAARKSAAATVNLLPGKPAHARLELK
jgi:GH35 family endo-1,4-beta-xylanase